MAGGRSGGRSGSGRSSATPPVNIDAARHARVFISYSRKDIAFAEMLVEPLTQFFVRGKTDLTDTVWSHFGT
jgi:hypothetical protein